MTIEEIEARWKAATPGPWRWDVDRGALWPTDWCVSDQDTPSDDDARAFASAPTDIAYLLDRVRKLERAHKILGPAASWQCEETGCLGSNGEVLVGTFFNCHEDCMVEKARKLEV